MTTPQNQNPMYAAAMQMMAQQNQPAPQADPLALNRPALSTRPVPTVIKTVEQNPRDIVIADLPDEIKQISAELTQQLRDAADEDLFQILLNNLGSGNTGVNFIQRFSVAPGGVPRFQAPSGPNGSSGQLYEHFYGVIPYIRQTRRYFEHGYGVQGSDNVPSCTSINVTRDRVGDVGFGNPGGSCAICPHNVFTDGVGRNCSERHAVFLVVHGNPFPVYLDMTVYSNRPIMDFLNKLSISSRVEYWQVVVKISLDKMVTRSGREVAIFKAEPVGVIQSDDPMVVKGIENLRKMCHMVLADFAKLVQSSKTQQFQDIQDPNVIEGVLVNSSQNMPLPQGMGTIPDPNEDLARLGISQMPAPQQPVAPQQPMAQPQQPVVPQAQPQMPETVMNVVAPQPQIYNPNQQPVPPMPPPAMEPQVWGTEPADLNMSQQDMQIPVDDNGNMIMGLIENGEVPGTNGEF